MLAALLAILHGAVSTIRTHRDLLAGIAALRQQLAIYKRTVPRPKLRAADRLFWMTLRHLWSGWRDALVIVKPETVPRLRAAHEVPLRTLRQVARDRGAGRGDRLSRAACGRGLAGVPARR